MGAWGAFQLGMSQSCHWDVVVYLHSGEGSGISTFKATLEDTCLRYFTLKSAFTPEIKALFCTLTMSCLC